jgi:hypothetical protein
VFHTVLFLYIFYSKKLSTKDKCGNKLQFSALAIIMQESGLILTYGMTKTESIKELEPLLREIAKIKDPVWILIGKN